MLVVVVVVAAAAAAVVVDGLKLETLSGLSFEGSRGRLNPGVRC